MISMGSFDMIETSLYRGTAVPRYRGTAPPESTSAAAIFLTKIKARLL
jgi:hypothetical protein